MCFICPFTLQSAERVFRSLHLKCHFSNSSFKQHNTQTLADLLGFPIPPWKGIDVLITLTKYFTELHTALCVGDWGWGQWCWAKSFGWCQKCNFRMSDFKNNPTELQPSPWKREQSIQNSMRDKSKCQVGQRGAWSRSWKHSALPRNPAVSGYSCWHWEHSGSYTARGEK